MTAATDNGIVTQLVDAVKAIEGVTLVEKPAYTIVKHGKTTLGYINGTRKVRVDLPMRGGVRANLSVATKADVTKAVKEMETFIPPLEREATPDPKPARKPRKSRAKGAKSEPDPGLAQVAELINEELAK